MNQIKLIKNSKTKRNLQSRNNKKTKYFKTFSFNNKNNRRISKNKI